jgi:hypothetical protein
MLKRHMYLAGPFKVNGVPLRRVNQVYVIATSTKVDASKADASKITDDFFKKAKKAVKKGESEFFTEDKEVSAATRPIPCSGLHAEDTLFPSPLVQAFHDSVMTRIKSVQSGDCTMCERMV